MRWRLLRRRLSISSPRMAVRSHLPWPLRWALVALMLGFSASLAMWAFEVGRNIAGLTHDSPRTKDAISELQQQLTDARRDRDQAQAIANSADSILKAERVTQQRLAEQVKVLESENLALKDDLGFFERLMPAAGEGISIRGLQVESPGPGQLRYQLLIMQQAGRSPSEFGGRVELLLSGLRDGQPWAEAAPSVRQPVQFKQYRRVEGLLQYPTGIVVKQVQVRVLDAGGSVRANQILRL